MKKCPFCAEKIQDDAIVCRYCGRDLPNSLELVPGEEKHNITSIRKSKRSVWAIGAIISGVITAIVAVYSIFTAPNNYELMGDLTVGLIATFLGWWLLATGIIALWRKSGQTSWGRHILVIGVLLLVMAGVVILCSLENRKTIAIFTPTPSLTVTIKPLPMYTLTKPVPMFTPTKESSPTPNNLIFFDDFANLNSGWNVGNKVYGITTEYVKGGYRIFTDGFYIAFGFPSLPVQRDVQIEVDVEKIAGTDYNFIGVTCRQSDSGFYSMGISSIGEAIIYIYKDGWLNVLNNPIFTSRYSSKVHIRGDCIGNELTLYVNNTKMVSATDNNFSNGYVGITALTRDIWNMSLNDYGGTRDTDILFDDFYVYKP